jgi:transposase-like protein
MRHHFRDRTERDDDVQPPTTCPACKSRELTTSKPVTSESYWRCLKCGEVWNAERLEAGSRYSPRFR